MTMKFSVCGAMTAVLMIPSGVLESGPAAAAVTISLKATSHITCANGVCAPTAKNAVLNAGGLSSMLSGGKVEVIEVTTTGKTVQAGSLVIDAGVSWTTSKALVLDAYQSIRVDNKVWVMGSGAMSLTTNDGGSGGTLSFGGRGRVEFSNLSSALTINGTGFNLVGSVKTLAAAIATDPGGSFALAENYDAKVDGTYSASPIPTTLSGVVEGLGNSIENLKISDANDSVVGLFAQSSGTISRLNVAKASITSSYFEGADVGALVGDNYGIVDNCHSSGKIQTKPKNDGTDAADGGLVGGNYGMIALSGSTAQVSSNSFAGGLVGNNQSSIDQSFASGAVSGNEAGGLVAYNNGAIGHSYATGDANGDAIAGGLVGENYATARATIDQAYSTGAVSAGYAGGLVGYDHAKNGTITDTYWDTDTSGITNLDQGAGNVPDDPGITGLSTAQFQAGLPSGFDSSVWKEEKKINGGLPYLIANPPHR